MAEVTVEEVQMVVNMALMVPLVEEVPLVESVA